MMYAVAKPVHIKRPHIDYGGESLIQWVPDLRFGTFMRNVDAKRAYLIAMQDLSADGEYTDDFIRAAFRYCTNLQLAKIVKVAA